MQMNTFVELAPLAAALAPAIVLATINAWLFLTGEEGTLLLPTSRRYPEIRLPAANLAPPAATEFQVQESEEPVLRKAA
jgi:hypothetical protein